MKEKEKITIKVLILGDSDVGKTSLLQKYNNNDFLGQSLPTIGVECYSSILINGNQKYNIQLWDTSGQERFKSLVKSFFRGAHGIIFTYDITNRESFINIKHWIENANSESSNFKKIIIGNKIDLEINRTVSFNELKEFAESYQCNYFETSAKSGKNIEKAILNLINQIIESKNYYNTNKSFSIEEYSLIKNKSKCC